MYLIAAVVAMLLATIGFSALAIGRINTRKVSNANDWTEAGVLAVSATEYALTVINKTPDWRSIIPPGVSVPSLEHPLGQGTFDVVFVDEDDGDLADQPSDPIRLYGIGHVGGATRVHSVLIQPEHGLDVLRMTIHAGAELQTKSGKELNVTGAPASSNYNVRNDEIIYGDIEAVATSGGGVTTGTTVIAAAKQMPDAGVFSMYQNMATEIPYFGSLVSQVLGPNYNPWGPTNEDGLYYIDTLGSDIDIQGARINGTLVIRTGGKTVRLKDAVFLHNYKPEYPALIVDGAVEISMKSDAMDLSEATWGANFNPPGAPYRDASDSDLTDTYPNEIRGLVHVLGTLRFLQATRIRGVVIGESTITVEVSPPVHIIHDPSIYDNPPVGYADPASPMAVIPGTWQWDASPNP
jgi:hypothetical protein